MRKVLLISCDGANCISDWLASRLYLPQTLCFNKAKSIVILSRANVILALLVLILTSLALGVSAIAKYPAFFAQPGAWTIILRLAFVLIAYASTLVWIMSTRDWNASREVILRNATLYGVFGGSLEFINIGIENFFQQIQTPILPIVFMLTIFSLWGVSGFQTARSIRSTRAGLLAAVSSAVICMLIAVTVGFGIEIFAPPEPAYISTWAEFKRSGWTDARAFGLANTFDSGLTHLIVAPMVAVVFGGLACFLASLIGKKERHLPR